MHLLCSPCLRLATLIWYTRPRPTHVCYIRYIEIFAPRGEIPFEAMVWVITDLLYSALDIAASSRLSRLRHTYIMLHSENCVSVCRRGDCTNTPSCNRHNSSISCHWYHYSSLPLQSCYQRPCRGGSGRCLYLYTMNCFEDYDARCRTHRQALPENVYAGQFLLLHPRYSAQ